MFFVYIIQNEEKRYYIGSTSNLEKRVRYHNSNLSRWTKMKGPWKLVYKESFATKTEALKRERFLKKQKNKNFYEWLFRV